MSSSFLFIMQLFYFLDYYFTMLMVMGSYEIPKENRENGKESQLLLLFQTLIKRIFFMKDLIN